MLKEFVLFLGTSSWAGWVLGFGWLTILVLRPSLFQRKRNTQFRYPFELSKAEWGNAHTKKYVGDIITAMPPNALTFHVVPDTFKPYDKDRADPAPGDPEKYLEVTYQFPGQRPYNIRRKQGEWIVLPMDVPFIDSTISEYVKDCETKVAEKVTLIETVIKEREAAYDKINQMAMTAQQLQASIAGLTNEVVSLRQSAGPLITIEYGPEPSSGWGNGLLLTNHGEPAFNLKISDISNGQQLATFADEIGTLTAGKPQWVTPQVKSLNAQFTSGSFIHAIPADVDGPTRFSVSYSRFGMPESKKSTACYSIVKSLIVDGVTVAYCGPSEEAL